MKLLLPWLIYLRCCSSPDIFLEICGVTIFLQPDIYYGATPANPLSEHIHFYSHHREAFVPAWHW